MKPKIFTFTDYYLPGFKGGGPIRSIANLINSIGDRCQFKVITRNHDLGDVSGYKGVTSDVWVENNEQYCCYISNGLRGCYSVFKVMLKAKKSSVFLNSFFSPKFSFYPLLLSKLLKVEGEVILAPRGEFYPGALNLKSTKKRLFIKLVKFFKLHKNITWLATTENEKTAILQYFPTARIEIILGSPPVKIGIDNVKYQHKNKVPGRLSVVFISRIAKNKNLKYAVDTVLKAKKNVTLDIYGPIEDEIYYNECMSMLKISEASNLIRYKGELLHDQILTTLSSYDLFFLPTEGENYSYIILESLCVGTPLLISNMTPWQNLKKNNLGFDIQLSDKNSFIQILDQWFDMGDEEHSVYRECAKNYAIKVCDDKSHIGKYLKIFGVENL